MFRWLALASILGCLAVSVFHRRRARRMGGTIRRRDETPTMVAARLLVGLPLWLSILTFLVNPSWMAWSSVPAPVWLRWVGVAMGLVAVPAAVWVFRSIGQNVSETVLTKSDHQLVTHGPYRWIRHPLYAMGLILVFGVGLMASNGLILILGVVAAMALRVGVIPAEERALIDAFGDEYREYMAGTGALVPRVGRLTGR